VLCARKAKSRKGGKNPLTSIQAIKTEKSFSGGSGGEISFDKK